MGVGRSSYNANEIYKLTLYAFILLTGTIGNAIVIKKFVFTEERKRPGSYFVAALAMVDMFSSIIIPFSYMTGVLFGHPGQPNTSFWPWGKGLCYISFASEESVFYMSAVFLAAISLERTR